MDGGSNMEAVNVFYQSNRNEVLYDALSRVVLAEGQTRIALAVANAAGDNVQPYEVVVKGATAKIVRKKPIGNGVSERVWACECLDVRFTLVGFGIRLTNLTSVIVP